MAKRGLFISFEGIDGCGKTTQTKLLSDYFAQNNQAYLLTREPGGEPLAEKLRDLLLNTHDEYWENESQILLFIAARLQHLRKIILPALKNGVHVICDRFHDSSRVYQGIANDIGVNFYDNLHRLVIGDIKPDLTFWLDIPIEIALERITLRNKGIDYFENQGIDFYEKLRSGFRELAQKEPQRIIKIDALQAPEIIQQHILAKLHQWQN